MMHNKHVTSLLLERLERIPADSVWAHHASGVRGSLLKLMEQLEGGQPVDERGMQQVISYAFRVLENAAREKTSSAARRRKTLDGKQTGSENAQNSAKE